MQILYLFLYSAIARCLAINSSDTDEERQRAYLRFHSYEMMGSPIRITTKKKEDGLWQRDFNDEESKCEYQECQKKRDSRKAIIQSFPEPQVSGKAGHTDPTRLTFVEHRNGSETEILPTKSLMVESKEVEDLREGGPNLLSDLEDDIQQTRNNLSMCYDGGVLRLKCYYSFKMAITALSESIHSAGLSEKTKMRVCEELRQTLLKILPMEEEARKICSKYNNQWEYCFYFSFDAYGHEIREIERMTRNILQEFIIFKNSSKRFFRNYKPKIDAQIARFDEVTSFLAAEWENKSEWIDVMKAKEKAAENIDNLSAFLENRRIVD